MEEILKIRGYAGDEGNTPIDMEIRNIDGETINIYIGGKFIFGMDYQHYKDMIDRSNQIWSDTN